MTVHYQVVHRTRYEYESDVSASYGELHLLLRDLPGQRCVASGAIIDPVPDDYRTWPDFFGNRAAYFSIQTTHRALEVTTTSVAAVEDRSQLLSGDEEGRGDQPWESAVRRLRRPLNRGGGAGELVDARQYVLGSPMVELSPTCATYATPSFPPGRPLIEAVTDLATRIHRDFAYRPGATSVSTTLADLFATQAGVCQDFAHLAIGCLRSLGLAARYVSGYLDTDPPPGQPKRRGADVSHAWFSVYVPGAGWVELDPTNDQLVHDRYVVTAWGRDYSDVPPLKGVIYTEGTTTSLDVSVDVTVVEDTVVEDTVVEDTVVEGSA